MLITFQSFGTNTGDFKVRKSNDAKSYLEFPIDYNDIGTSVYGDTYKEKLSYKEVYLAYVDLQGRLLPAIKNFFLAYDTGFNKKLRNIDTSYWQIVMYMSAIESLLPQPIFCKGKCNKCDKEIYHITSSGDKELAKLLFSRIKDKNIRDQYKSVFYDVKRKIRNDTIHNGLFPSAGVVPMADGTKKYSTNDALSTYQSDRYSLELLVEQLQQICRFMFLNSIIKRDIFPQLKDFDVHSVTIRPS
jgi:hypothetical protein